MEKIRLYTKDYCSYCQQAKNLLQSLNIDFDEIDVSQDPATLAQLIQQTGSRTVPQIFIGDQFIGGFTELLQLHQQRDLRQRLTGASSVD